MNFRDMVFIAVAENLSFSKAADELFISQPAITKHIRELERQLNEALFERKGNKIYLTRQGKITYRHLKQIHQQYAEMEFELSRQHGHVKGALSIGASSTISQYVIPSAIASFHHRYPGINVSLFNGNSFEMEQLLIENKIDLAVVENASSKAGIRYQKFMDDEIIIVTGSQSAFARRNALSAEEIQQIPIVLREQGSGTLEVIYNELKKQGINLEKLNIHMHLGSTEAIKNFLPKFDGIALLSEKAIDKELQLNVLKKLNIANLRIYRQFRFARLQGHEYKIPETLINFLFNYNF